MSVDGPLFREVIGRFTSGVAVVTTSEGDAVFATTASAVTSLSDAPPTILVCLNRTSDTGQAVTRTGRLALSILAWDQEDLAVRLAGKGPSKLDGVRFTTGPAGLPLLDAAIASLECTVTNRASAETHDVFFGRVDALEGRDGVPLVYYRGRFSRLESVAS